MAQRVKDLALSLQQLGLVRWHEFHPWPQNFHMLQAQSKKERGCSESKPGSSCHGSEVTELISVHEDSGSIPGLSHWVKDPALPKLRCRWQAWLASGVAVAVV